jgi:hypothetical protein
MPKKKPLQGCGPIRGNEAFTISQIGFNGDIPLAAYKDLESEIAGLIFGSVSLVLYIKDGHLIRYTTSRERSFVPEKPTARNG